MTKPSILAEPNRVDEPKAVEEYQQVLSQVASDGRAVIVCRHGEDLAAVIPLTHLELLRELVAREEIEKMAADIDWERLVPAHPPAQEWFEGDEPKPF
jgi:hypothetical protein